MQDKAGGRTFSQARSSLPGTALRMACLQRLRYVGTGLVVGVRGVGGKPAVFCLHFCQTPGSSSGLDATEIVW